MHPRLRTSVLVAGAALAAAVVPIGVQQATASPHLSLAQVQARVAALNGQMERITESYDGARAQLATISKRQQATAAELSKDKQTLARTRSQLARSASAAYRTGGLSPTLSLVTNGSPATYLDQASSLDALSSAQADQVAAAAAANRAVAAVQAQFDAEVAQQRRTVADIGSRKSAVQHLLGQEQALYNRLKAADRRRLEQARQRQQEHELALRASYRAPAAAAAPHASYTGPASGQAAAAVRFAYAQLGKPYVYGASGPNSYDCSGLTMSAWAAAGVGIPRTAAAQQGSVHAVSLSAMQPGDLIFFGSPAYHVAIYIGGGRMIQAPHTGASVEITPVSYMSPSGAGRP
jgi:cell wall-associated NlpC family hydrolase